MQGPSQREKVLDDSRGPRENKRFEKEILMKRNNPRLRGVQKKEGKGFCDRKRKQNGKKTEGEGRSDIFNNKRARSEGKDLNFNLDRKRVEEREWK